MGGGCDEDCFNCPYPDCYKPALQMKKEKNRTSGKSKKKPAAYVHGNAWRCRQEYAERITTVLEVGYETILSILLQCLHTR